MKVKIYLEKEKVYKSRLKSEEENETDGHLIEITSEC